MKRTLAAFALVFSAAALSACTSAPTEGPAPSPPAVTCSVGDCSVPAVKYSALMRSTLESMDGFAGLSADAETNTIQLAWVGTPPKAALDVVRKNDTEFSVSFVAAKYTLREMNAATSLLASDIGTGMHVGDAVVKSVSVDDRGLALMVTYEGQPKDAAAVEAAVTKLTGVDTVAVPIAE